jgi:hypothetical protein
MIPEMDRTQEQELREWANALTAAREADRKAMGRAILMLLGQVESLRAELDRAAAAPPPQTAPAEEPPAAEQDEPTDTIAVYEGATSGLRGLLRMPHRPKSPDD